MKKRAECHLEHRVNTRRITKLQDRAEENIQNAV